MCASAGWRPQSVKSVPIRSDMTNGSSTLRPFRHELGARVDNLARELQTQREDMKSLDATVQKQGQETKNTFAQLQMDVNESMQKGFNQIEALLSKRPRVASNSPSG